MRDTNDLDTTVVAHEKFFQIGYTFPQRCPFVNGPLHERIVFDAISTFSQLFVCCMLDIPPIRVGVLGSPLVILLNPRVSRFV